MKKIYLLAVFALGLGLSANAQFTDDMEAYSLGPIFTPRWATWSGDNSGDENITSSSDNSASGTRSGFIDNGQGPQDAMLVLGNQTSGTWSVAWNMFIPTGASAYFNVQGETEANGGALGGTGVFNSGNIQFDNAGSVTDDNANGGGTLAYPPNTWFDVTVEVDLDNTSYILKVNNVAADTVAFGAGGDTMLGAIDFFAFQPDNAYFVDDVRFASGVLGVDDFSGDVFSVFPNPVVNTLNIKSASVIDNVTIYDVLGKQVLSVSPDAISPSVDMSTLSSGAYLVNVTIGDATKTIKVLK